MHRSETAIFLKRGSVRRRDEINRGMDVDHFSCGIIETRGAGTGKVVVCATPIGISLSLRGVNMGDVRDGGSIAASLLTFSKMSFNFSYRFFLLRMLSFVTSSPVCFLKYPGSRPNSRRMRSNRCTKSSRCCRIPGPQKSSRIEVSIVVKPLS